jgi:agmatinase
MNGPNTFYGLPYCSPDSIKQGQVHIAILGIPEAASYDGKASHSAGAPQAIRAAARRYANEFDHYDFDLGGPLIDDKSKQVIDCGDLAGDPQDPEGNFQKIERTVKSLRSAGAVPVILGGDDSVPIPVFSAFEDSDPLTIVQIDAHIDWRHERYGVTHGYSSTMRRAAEMPWIGTIIQVGMRGVGSARPQEVADANAYGVKFITAREVFKHGVQAVLDQVPEGNPCIVTIDCDGLDPAVMPAVMAPAPGGLTYRQVIDIIHGVARTGNLVGFDLVEFAPQKDINSLGAITAARIVCNAIGTLVRHYPPLKPQAYPGI